MEKNFLQILIPTKAVRQDLLLNLLNQLSSLGLEENVFLIFDIENSQIVNFFQKQFPKIKVKCFNSLGFSKVTNQGIKELTSEYVLVMNDDVIVYPEFIDDLFQGLNSGFDMVSPVSNYVGGIQIKNVPGLNEKNFLNFVQSYRKNPKNQVILISSFVSGFCFLTKTSLLKKYMFDERLINYFSDNLLSFRLFNDGYNIGVLEKSFIYHFGSQTLNTYFSENTYFKDFETYLDILNTEKQEPRIAGVLRIKNAIEYLENGFLDEYIKSVDKLYVCDTGSNDGTYEYLKEIKDIVLVRFKETEDKERSLLNQMAYKDGYNWAFWLDADECPDEYLTKDYLKRIINNSIFPEVNSFLFRILTFWRGNKHHRVDGVWGNLAGTRLFKLIKNKTEWISSHPTGLHPVPYVAMDNYGKRVSCRKILHFGYNTFEKAYEKYLFYNTIDKFQDEGLIGSKNYQHLIDETNLSLIEYFPKSLGLFCITKQKEFKHTFFMQLRKNFSLFDDIVIGIDDRSNPKLKELIQKFGFKFKELKFSSFSQMRNQTKKELKTDYIFFLDDDEILFNEFEFSKILENKADAFVFEINNIIESKNLNYKTYCIRLFKNEKEAKFKGKIHETINGFQDKEINFAGNFIINIKKDIDLKFYQQEILKAKDPLNMAKLMIDLGNYDQALKYLDKVSDKESIKNFLITYIYLLKAKFYLNRTQSYGNRKKFLNSVSIYLNEILRKFLIS